MAKRGMFGGSRFGYSGFGRSGFKRGFGRASFGRKAEVPGFGIAEDMMRMFKEMQTPGFGEKPPSAFESVVQRPKPQIPGPLYEPPAAVGSPYWDSPTSGLNPVNPAVPKSTKQTKAGGNVGLVKVRFRPKLTPPAR